MTISLDWSKPISHKGGLFVQTAQPNEAFWNLWHYSKEELSRQGIYIKRVYSGKTNFHWMVKRVIEIKDDKPVPRITVPVPLTDTSLLFPYQPKVVAGINAALIAHNKALNLSDTGTGKTYMALATARELNLCPCIICPLSIIADWKRLCKLFKVKPLFIINWESAKSDKFMYVKKIRKRYAKGYDFHWLVPNQVRPLFIFDEVHKANSEYTQNLDLLIGALKYPVLGMSATLTDTIAKFKGVGKMLNLFEGKTFDLWLRSRGLIKNKYGEWASLNSKKDMLFLSEFIFPEYGARISKDDIPDFPECQNIAQLCVIKNERQQNEAYQILEIEIQKLKELHRENKISGNQAQGELLTLQLRYRQLAEMLKIDLLVQFAKDLLEQGFSVPIFVNFTDTIHALSEKLQTECIIDGNITGELRIENIQDFQSDKERVILCNIRAGGVGVSLHDLNGNYPRAALICPTYSAKDLIQVCGRIHRAGAKSRAINYLIYGAGTIEEKIYSSVKEKIRNVSILNDGELGDKEFFEL